MFDVVGKFGISRNVMFGLLCQQCVANYLNKRREFCLINEKKFHESTVCEC